VIFFVSDFLNKSASATAGSNMDLFRHSYGFPPTIYGFPPTLMDLRRQFMDFRRQFMDLRRHFYGFAPTFLWICADKLRFYFSLYDRPGKGSSDFEKSP
jgi:hypothetical protein